MVKRKSSVSTRQESFITADITQDPTLLEVFTTGCKDMHNIIAKKAYPKILKDCKVEDVKKYYPEIRQKSKGIEFTIYYGGDFNTLAGNMNISKEEAKAIYDNIMNSLPGLKKYQDYCRKVVMENGYILLCPQTGHKAYIYDFDELKEIKERLKDPEYYNYYREMCKTDPGCDTVTSVKRYYRRKKESEKQCIDYKVQGRGSMCFKLSSILLFNYIKKNRLQDTVKYVIPVHDELNLECPEGMSTEIANVLEKCMVKGAAPFLKSLSLTASAGIYDHWVH